MLGYVYERDNKREAFLDILKCFAIFLVLYGHSIQYLTPQHFENCILFKFIYSFHMPLFAMISGYFSFPSMNLNIKIFFINMLNDF